MVLWMNITHCTTPIGIEFIKMTTCIIIKIPLVNVLYIPILAWEPI